MKSADRTAAPALAGGLLIVLVVQGIGRFGYTPLLPHMQTAEGFGPDVGGYIASANYWGYLLGALLATPLATSRHRLRWLWTAISITVATTALMAFADSPWSWALIRGVAGLAGGLAIVLGATLTQEAVRRFQVSNWAGIYFSGVGFGIALTGTLVWFLADAMAWQRHWLLLGLISFLLVLPVYRWFQSRPPVSRTPDHDEKIPSRRWSLPVWLLIVAYFLDGFGYVASTTFLVSIIAAVPGLEHWGNKTWILVGLAAAPSCILWALLIPRFGLFRLLIAIYALQAFAIVVPVVLGGVSGAVFGGLLFGATFLSAISMSFNLAAYLVPRNTGRLLGVMTALFGAGQIIGPAVCGWLAARTGSFDLALLLSASSIGLAALALVVANVAHGYRGIKSNRA